MKEGQMKNRRDLLIKLVEREMRFLDIRELAQSGQKAVLRHTIKKPLRISHH